MAILENIRKRTTILILIIGMALFAFVISGIFTSDNLSGGPVGSTVGEVNGTPISIEKFREELELASNRYGNQTSSTQLVNSVWSQQVRATLLKQQFEELGIDIGQDQIMNLIRNSAGYGQSPQFQDENGNFDENLFRAFIADLQQQPNQDQFNLWLQDEQAIIQSAKEQTYFNLIRAGVGASLVEGQKDYHLANDKMDIKYVRVPFSSIADSTLSIGKSDIEAYIREHQDEFEQEASRDVQFVYFEEKASEEDIAKIQEEIRVLMDDRIYYNEANDRTDTLPGFRNTTDIASFLLSNSDSRYDTLYRPKNLLPTQFADTLMGLNVGEIYGPYRDNNSFKVSRMMGRRPNGSVQSSHILIAYEGSSAAGPNTTRTKEEAEARAQELLTEAQASDADFAQLARDNSEGPSAPNGGDLGFYQRGQLAKEFNDFIFENPVGTIGLVETEFGFHIIKVTGKQDLVNLATLSREMEPSVETINALFTEATTLEMEAVNGDEAFLDIAEAKGYTVRPVNALKAMDENLPGLGPQRRVVQWAFNPETAVGDIRRFDVANGYAIVQLTNKEEAGTMSTESASTQVLPILRKQRKAAQIIAANQGKSLEDFASSNGVIVSNATALNVKAPTIPGAGSEPTVVGTAFSMEAGEVSGLIEGETGVFMIEVTQKSVAPDVENYSTYANSIRNANRARVATGVYNALNKKAEIEDNRATFY